MGERTGIEWTDATWNPVTGCTKVSTGCDHCYAELLAHKRLRDVYLKRKPARPSLAARRDPFASGRNVSPSRYRGSGSG